MSDDERIEQLELENKVLQDNNKGLKAKIDELQKKLDKKDKLINLMVEDRAEISEPKVSEEAIINYYFKMMEEENE